MQLVRVRCTNTVRKLHLPFQLQLVVHHGSYCTSRMLFLYACYSCIHMTLSGLLACTWCTLFLWTSLLLIVTGVILLIAGFASESCILSDELIVEGQYVRLHSCVHLRYVPMTLGLSQLHSGSVPITLGFSTPLFCVRINIHL